MELVSIIVPVYNAERFLEEGVASILKQDYSNLELILVDDCSTDNSLAKLHELQAKYTQHKIIVAQNERNMGPGPTRNHGFNLSQGKYVYFMDVDDRAENNLLSSMVQELERTQADLVVFALDCFGDSTNKYFINKELLACSTREEWQHKYHLFVHAPWNKLLRRSFLVDNQIEFPDVPGYEDAIWSTNVILAAKKIAIYNHILYHYYIHHSSLSHTKSWCIYIDALMEGNARLLKQYQLWDSMQKPFMDSMLNICDVFSKRLTTGSKVVIFDRFYRTAAKLQLKVHKQDYPWYQRYPAYKLLPKFPCACNKLREQWKHGYLLCRQLYMFEKLYRSYQAEAASQSDKANHSQA